VEAATATSGHFASPPIDGARMADVPDAGAEPPLLTGARKRLRLSSLSPLRYPGSKRKMIPAIRQLIEANEPPPRLFVEPFCGGASVSLGLLELNAVERVLLADLDPLVSALWREATTNGPELVRDMRKLDVTLERWDHWRAARPKSDRQLALKCLFLNRTTFSGIVGGHAGPIGGRAQSSANKIDCRFNEDGLADRILNVWRLAREGRILQVPEPSRWQTTLDRAKWPAAEFDAKETIFYLDPPYIEKADRIYELAFKERDHRDLAARLLGTKHRWMLSYDAEPLVLGLYRGLSEVREYRIVHHYTMTGSRTQAVPRAALGSRRERAG
jgi:DNA adenine methylase